MEVDLAINRWCGVVQYEMLSQSMGHGFSYHIVVGTNETIQV